MEKIVFHVKGLDCAEEVALLHKVLGRALGVQELSFNIMEAKMTVLYDAEKITPQEMEALVSQTGMKAVLWQEKERLSLFVELKSRLIFTLLSGLFLLIGFCVHVLEHPQLRDLLGGAASDHSLPLASKVCYGLAILCGVWQVLPKAFYSARHLQPDMNLLMVIAIIGAIGIQAWFEGGAVAFLFSLSLLLEQWTISRAKRSVAALLSLSPARAQIFNAETRNWEEKEVSQVKVGERMRVRPGEKIPLDALVVQGSSSVNQAAITGESVPVEKKEGEEVFAGTLNMEGALECEVNKLASNTALAKIIALVEQARSKRSESEQWVETFARYYTPLMLLFALLVALIPPLFLGAAWTTWIYHGLVLLVIACPCALVISTPVSIVCGLTAAARKGVLIKGGTYLEEAGKLKGLALDKTGTLTHGRPQVQQIVPLAGHTTQELMEKAVALEASSEHPLGRAIFSKGMEMGIAPTVTTQNYQAIKGKGALATFKEKLYWIGSHRFMHEMEQETEEVHLKALALEDAGHSIVAIGNDRHVCGLISIADAPRPYIRETLTALKAAGIEEILMLTGDNQPTAKAIASQAGVDTYYAELLPDEKVEKVQELLQKWEKVGMVGDGINDAPAMATATVGIAMGAMGTDAAIETADIALMADDLSQLPWLIRYGKRVLRIIKTNIGFSLSVKGIFILLALLNLATLWMAIAADTGATILVIFNALRLLKD